MAKEKKAKDKRSIPNKNVHLRLSFLHQAALYLSNHANATEPTRSGSSNESCSSSQSSGKAQQNGGQSRYLLNHMKGVSRKSVITLDKEVKRKVCKGCDQLLNAYSSVRVMENESKGGRKPWADVLVVKCRNCGTPKRFPREKEKEKVADNESAITTVSKNEQLAEKDRRKRSNDIPSCIFAAKLQ